jgi:hypothetical protein
MKQMCAAIRRFLMAGAETSILALAATAWTEKILHRFASNGTDGYAPVYSNVAVDASGNVFGTAGGGTSGSGVIFEIKP